MIESIEGAVGIYLASFVIAIVSAVVPLVNAELYLIGVIAATGRGPEALVLAAIVAAGQMVGKSVIYQTARGATHLGQRSPGFAAKLERAKTMVERWRRKPLVLTFVSAWIGLPPFYLVSMVAGVLEIRFRAFVVLGLIGRTLRFATIAVIAMVA